MILDHNVLYMRSYFRINHECDCPLIISVNCDCLFKKTAQHLLGVSLKLKYKINLFPKTDKKLDIPIVF